MATKGNSPMPKRAPRWVYVFGACFIVASVALFLIQHLVFGVGGHAR